MIKSSNGTESLSDQHDLAVCEFAEKNLYTAVVSDSMDQLGVRHQAMREYLRPLYASCKVRRVGAHNQLFGSVSHAARSVRGRD